MHHTEPSNTDNNKNRLSLATIEKWLRDEHWFFRAAALNACQGRDVPPEWIEAGLHDEDRDVRETALNACQGRDVPMEWIEASLRDEDEDVRVAALNACQGKNVPPEWIEAGLRDGDVDVRAAASDLCKQKGGPLPLIRTIEPPETVYKKCVGSVIVCASIPKDAQVRGQIGRKCRASKAIITDIIGDVDGEKIGISRYDRKTLYFIGDEVEIEDFEMSNEEYLNGFHFFCTEEEAWAY